jgi:hypothetical protein
MSATTVYLTGVSTPESRASDRANLGLLITPHNSTHLQTAHYPMFGADNGFYSLGAKKDPTPEAEAAATAKWGSWVVDEVAPRRELCRFVTIPDVLNWIEVDGKRVPVGDAAGTLARFGQWAEEVRAFGLPAALVLQDGIEVAVGGLHAGGHYVGWDEVDAVFVGGSDGFKLGPDAERICRKARALGKWVHVGRVNSWKRIDLVRDWADSVDGTFLGFAPKTNWPRLTAWLDRLDATTPPAAERRAA